MSAHFVNTSDTYLSAPNTLLTAYPFSVGYWVYPTGSAVFRAHVSVGDSSASNQYIYVGQNDSNQLSMVLQSGGTADTAVTGTLIINRWNYAVARFYSATSRRLDLLSATGIATSASDATSRAFPTGSTTFSIGNYSSNAATTLHHDGFIAEVFFSTSTIQADAAALNASLLRQLAYGGPFSVPHVAGAIIEYRSLRSDPTLNDPNEIYSRQPLQTWTNHNGVTLGHHPPLPYWYVKPRQTMSRAAVLLASEGGGGGPVESYPSGGKLIGGILTRPKLIRGRLAA
jgi:hypothetical protein